jgi:hypothetical protein
MAKKPKIDPEKIFVSSRIIESIDSLQGFSEFLSESVDKFMDCDWGDCAKEDCELNNKAVSNNERILAAYTFGTEKIFIIREHGKNNIITIIFADEY